MTINSQLNRAAAIRELLLELGIQTPPREIIGRLRDNGIDDVSPQQVSNEKAKLRKKGAVARVDDLPVSVLKKVKSLVDEIGSIEVVRRALDELLELQKVSDAPRSMRKEE
jgi:hypothetical protein